MLNSSTFQVINILYRILFLAIGLPLTFFGYKTYRIYFFFLGFLRTFYLVSYIYIKIFYNPGENSRSYAGKLIGSALGGLIGGATAAYCSCIGWLMMIVTFGNEFSLYVRHIITTNDTSIRVTCFVLLSVYFLILLLKFKRGMLYISTSLLGSIFCMKAGPYFEIAMTFDVERPPRSYTPLALDERIAMSVIYLSLSLLGVISQVFISKK